MNWLVSDYCLEGQSIFSHSLTSPITSITCGWRTIVKNQRVTFGKCFLKGGSKARVYAVKSVIAIMISAIVIDSPARYVCLNR